ncbi:universal stress protein [Streptomyces sp. NPDC056689]|uniref:universal stress protein n=1 Tax=Streptomyces sp. NPDC056689 TaxID=3345911 RepID=UPI0036A7E91E
MSSGASVSPHGFVTGRGRGYRPEQVDALAAELSQGRDDARERVALLTARVEELEAEAQRLRLAVTQLAPQTYESLGDRAREILALAEEEADGVRAAAADDVRRITQDAEARARETREAARAAAVEDIAGEHERSLTAVAEQVRHEFPDLNVEADAAKSMSVPAVLVEASRHADLLVMGGRRSPGFIGSTLGRATHSLVHHAECPVLLLPRNDTEHRGES